MSPTVAVMKRELKGYFGTPVAYVFLVVFLALSAHLAFTAGLFEARDANLQAFFRNLPMLFVLLAPAIAMRMWAEERRSGTIELLLTLPITVRQAVLGKFLAGWVFFGIALLATGKMVVMIALLGDPDMGPIFSGYLGAFLMAGGYLAIGAFFSALTKNQVIAFILGAVACWLVTIAGAPSTVSFFDTLFGSLPARFVESMSFLSHYDAMQRGVIELRNIFFMFAVATGFLVSCIVMLNSRKAA